jgi:hypothetical protein
MDISENDVIMTSSKFQQFPICPKMEVYGKKKSNFFTIVRGKIYNIFLLIFMFNRTKGVVLMLGV